MKKCKKIHNSTGVYVVLKNIMYYASICKNCGYTISGKIKLKEVVNDSKN